LLGEGSPEKNQVIWNVEGVTNDQVRFPWGTHTKDRYIKAINRAVVAAMKKLEATVDLVNQSAPRVHQI